MKKEISSTTKTKTLRLVCLSYDAVAILGAIGCAQMVVGKPSGTGNPAVEDAVSIGDFASPDIELIARLNPDLVIGYSEIHAATASRLIKQNIPVLILQHACLEEIYRSINMLGRITGHEPPARSLVETMKREFEDIAHQSSTAAGRPVVYFEEWDNPHTCGMQWVSEIIAIAGGIDCFSELAVNRQFSQREISAKDIQNTAPDIILASWCGKPVATDSFLERPGWANVPAVRENRIHEIPGEIILQPGPSLTRGARYIHEILSRYAG